MLRLELSSQDEKQIKTFLQLFEQQHIILNETSKLENFHVYVLRLLDDAYQDSNIRKSVTNDNRLQELEKENNQLKAEIKRLTGTRQDNSKNIELSAVVGLYRTNGLSYQEIADKLNSEGRTNSRNKPFIKMTVQRLHKKYEAEQQRLLKK